MRNVRIGWHVALRKSWLPHTLICECLKYNPVFQVPERKTSKLNSISIFLYIAYTPCQSSCCLLLLIGEVSKHCASQTRTFGGRAGLASL